MLPGPRLGSRRSLGLPTASATRAWTRSQLRSRTSPATCRKARSVSAGRRCARPATGPAAPDLELLDARGRLSDRGDQRLGSQTARRDALADLFGRATEGEQQFLRGLLLGELRQGALEGVMVEAVAKAAEVPAARVRRAAMVAGDLGAVAAAALADGSEGYGSSA